MGSQMDPFIEKIEELKKQAELVKRTCPCQNAPAATPPRSKKKPKRGSNASSGAVLANGNHPSPSNAPAYKVYICKRNIRNSRHLKS